MRDRIKTAFLTIAVLICFAAPGIADPFEDGAAAYSRRDYATALRLWRSLADQGDAAGQNGLGVLHSEGRGVAQDDAEAVKWYRKAADQGLAKGLSNLGFMYAEGRGVARDDAEAVKWWRKAADQGFADAQSNLGAMYAGGRGVARDDAEAVKWYRRAADQGLADAQYNLGGMYAEGRGVTRDDAEAVKWYRKAADQGFAGAQTRLGVISSAAAQDGDLENTVYLDTKDGRVVIKMRPDLAPNHVERIKELTRAGFYDGLKFHRVIEGFMAQTGDPTGTGMGDSGKPDLKPEFTHRASFTRGVVGMARDPGDMDSANSQFFICFDDARFLDGQYTIWGQVVSGMEFVDKIKKGSPYRNGEIADPDVIVKMRMAGQGAPPPVAAAPPPVAAAPPPVAAAPPKAKFSTQPVAIEFPKGPPRPNDVAVIIGNADYGKQGKDIPDVTPAYADAESFKRYALTALGIDEANIIDLRDATSAQMVRVFGSKEDHRGQLYDWVRAGASRVIVYYAGHGAPEADKEGGGREGSAYLVPADADGGRIKLNGYPLSTLYANLAKSRAESVTVVLEACFSGASQGGSLIRSASPVFLTPRLPKIPPGVTVITAGSEQQLASWEEDGSHGLFTKYYLMGMSGKADANHDKTVTPDELRTYLEGTVTYYARRYYGRDQTPQVNWK